jgi:hypothetical protein
VDQNTAEVTHIPQADTRAIEAWLKSLWDRAKKAAELISLLREEKAELQTRVASMEEELTRVRQELTKDEEVIRTLSAGRGEEVDDSVFSNGEREQLSAKVKDLLAKLEGYV